MFLLMTRFSHVVDPYVAYGLPHCWRIEGVKDGFPLSFCYLPVFVENKHSLVSLFAVPHNRLYVVSENTV